MVNANLLIVQENLEKHNIRCFLVPSKEAALSKALSLIPKGSQVGIGGSVSVQQIGLYDALSSGEYDFLNPYKEGLTHEQKMDLRRRGSQAEWFVTGSNAITLDGWLVNEDWLGNRAAAIIYGPRHVLVVVGLNKLVNTISDALERVQNVAAPANAKRLKKQVPCTVTGKCENCSSPERICSVMSIVKWMPPEQKDRITVILVDDDLGL